METDTLPDVDTVRAMAAQGRTDAQIGEALNMPAIAIKHFRRQHGIVAGYYQVPQQFGWGRRARQATVPRPEPLDDDELAVLRRLEREGLRNAPPKRGYCRDCELWLLLDGGRLPIHQARRVGVDRRLADRCSRSLNVPPRIDGDR
jgi:hypothetical protein